MKKKTMNLKEIWTAPDCCGWVWHIKGRQYNFQPDNDPGLFDNDWDLIEQLNIQEKILRKIKMAPGQYIYVLKNTEHDTDTTYSATLITIKALFKKYHHLNTSKHENMLIDRYYREKKGR